MAKLFSGGVPTDIDVQRLSERWAIPDEGTLIPYTEVAALIGVAHGSNRYRSVVSAWRRRLLREPFNRLLKARPDLAAYQVLDSNGRVSQCIGWDRHVRRTHRRIYLVAGSTDAKGLSAENQAARTHLMQTSATALQASRMQAKKTAPLLADSNVSH